MKVPGCLPRFWANIRVPSLWHILFGTRVVVRATTGSAPQGASLIEASVYGIPKLTSTAHSMCTTRRRYCSERSVHSIVYSTLACLREFAEKRVWQQVSGLVVIHCHHSILCRRPVKRQQPISWDCLRRCNIGSNEELISNLTQLQIVLRRYLHSVIPAVMEGSPVR